MSVTIEVDVDLEDFSTEDLITELTSRENSVLSHNHKQLIEKIYQLRRFKLNYQPELDALIYNVLGKIA